MGAGIPGGGCLEQGKKLKRLKGSHCERDGQNPVRRVGGLPREAVWR